MSAGKHRKRRVRAWGWAADPIFKLLVFTAVGSAIGAALILAAPVVTGHMDTLPLGVWPWRR